MNIEQFNYTLPDHFIAQTPLTNRDESKLLVVDPITDSFTHHKFSEITSYLAAGDCLVLNDTKVLPARLHGVKPDTGGKIEILLLNEQADDCWEVLAKPARRLPIGSELTFGNGRLRAICIGKKDYGSRVLRFSYEGIFYDRLKELGEMPLPPYIHETLEQQDRYQTIYAKEQGSAAAPTAGLHMTDEILQSLKDQGVHIAFVTLHVGLDTFRPVSTENIKEHKMHSEFYTMDETTAQTLNNVREQKGRIIALGTTTTRVLETVATNHNGSFEKSSGWTDIFIYPPYDFQAIDGLITNFHLPKSTLLMLVSAFAGRELILAAYEEAKAEAYRFFSFGDAMLILPSKDD